MSRLAAATLSALLVFVCFQIETTSIWWVTAGLYLAFGLGFGSGIEAYKTFKGWIQ